MSDGRSMAAKFQCGLVLTELLVAGLMMAFLMLGLVQMAAAASRGLLLMESLSQPQQGARFAVQQLQRVVMGAGYSPEPWTRSAPLEGIGDESEDGGSGTDDVLAVRQISDRNCFENPNPVVDASGAPLFYLRHSIFETTAGDNLAHTCYYGPEGEAMVRQINRQGLVQGVESFQVLYAEDLDGDAGADRRVRAGRWDRRENVVGIDVGILTSSEKALAGGAAEPLTVLDQTIVPASDGRVRTVWTIAIPIGSRLR